MDKNKSPEVDFLLEMEFRLQQDLNAVHRRLDAVLGDAALGETVEFPVVKPARHLFVVPNVVEIKRGPFGPPDTVA